MVLPTKYAAGGDNHYYFFYFGRCECSDDVGSISLINYKSDGDRWGFGFDVIGAGSQRIEVGDLVGDQQHFDRPFDPLRSIYGLDNDLG